MCGFPRGVTNILDPAQTGQPWTPERIQQFGGLDPATARASGLTEQGYPISSTAIAMKEGPASIPTNPSVSAAGGPSTFGQPRQAGADPTTLLPRTLLGT